MIYSYLVRTHDKNPKYEYDIISYDTNSGALYGEYPERQITQKLGLIASNFIVTVLNYEIVEEIT
jgi:hypothetical protein